jgi:hypothetical protein
MVDVKTGDKHKARVEDLRPEIQTYLDLNRASDGRVLPRTTRAWADLESILGGDPRAWRRDDVMVTLPDPPSPRPEPASPLTCARLLRRLERAGDAARKRMRMRATVPTPRAFFHDMLPDGDFEWEDSGDGDWHYEQDDEQWRKFRPTVDYARKDGVLSITRGTSDEDGHDVSDGIDLREEDLDKVDNEWIWMYYDLNEMSLDWFLGVARYNIHLLEGGEDVLGDCYRVPRRKDLLRRVREQITSVECMGR